jgi:hypothetical protein
MLTHTGWRWLGWPKRSGMPDRPSQLFEGEALRRLEGSDLLRQASNYERIVCPPSLYFIATPA